VPLENAVPVVEFSGEPFPKRPDPRCRKASVTVEFFAAALLGLQCEHHRGLMTNTTKTLLKIAQTAGSKSLFGRTKKGNSQSAGVLRRSGFTFDKTGSESDDLHDLFRINLKGRKSEHKPVLDNVG
jgi:hypothetical protein